MRTAIFYDTETTGFPSGSKELDDPCQPHIVQLAAAMVDLDERQVLSSINVISLPDGWTIPKQASDVHGITDDRAKECGIPESQVIELFTSLIKYKDYSFREIVAHNGKFDAQIISIALSRFNKDASICDLWGETKSYCTMTESIEIVKCPPTAKMAKAGRKHFKNPNLGEAYKHFTGKDLVGAHDAMVDVQACMAVYFGIVDHDQMALLDDLQVLAW